MFYRLFLSGRYWFTVLVTCGICTVLDLAWAALRKRVLPSKLDIWMEHEQLLQRSKQASSAASAVPDSFAVSHRQILAQQIHLIVRLFLSFWLLI